LFSRTRFFSKPIVIVTLRQLARGKSDAHGAIFNCDTKSRVLITLQLVKIVHVQIRLSVFNLKQGEWNSDKVTFIFSTKFDIISGISALIDGPHFVVKFYMKNRPEGWLSG
jgi:hypothetical protein